METNLILVYKSAIESMKKEVARLHCCDFFQKYNFKLQAYQIKIKELTEQISNSEVFDQTKQKTFKNSDHKNSSQKDSSIMIQAKIEDLRQKITDETNEKIIKQNLIDDKLKAINHNLFVLVSKYNTAKTTNFELKKSQKKLILQRKILTDKYFNITQNLLKEPTLTNILEQIEFLHKKNKEKSIKLTNLQNRINDLKSNSKKTNPEVKKFVEKIRKIENTRCEFEITKKSLQIEIEKKNLDIENAKNNPRKFSSATANKNLKKEIKKLELEIAEKSKKLKEYEKEKLLSQVRLSAILQKKAEIEPKARPKSLSNCFTVSSLKIGRTSKNNFSKDSDQRTKNSSIIFSKLPENNQGFTLTKDALKVLDGYAPGEGLTAKIIAYNRSCISLRNSFS